MDIISKVTDVKRYYSIGDDDDFKETNIKSNNYLMHLSNFAEWAVKKYILDSACECMDEAQDQGIDISIYDKDKNLLGKFNVNADYDIYCVAHLID